jgi:hypothetical protein
MEVEAVPLEPKVNWGLKQQKLSEFKFSCRRYATSMTITLDIVYRLELKKKKHKTT